MSKNVMDDYERDLPWLRRKLGVNSYDTLPEIKKAVTVLKKWARFSYVGSRQRLRGMMKLMLSCVKTIQRAWRAYRSRRDRALERRTLQWINWWHCLFADEKARGVKETYKLIRTAVERSVTECGLLLPAKASASSTAPSEGPDGGSQPNSRRPSEAGDAHVSMAPALPVGTTPRTHTPAKGVRKRREAVDPNHWFPPLNSLLSAHTTSSEVMSVFDGAVAMSKTEDIDFICLMDAVMQLYREYFHHRLMGRRELKRLAKQGVKIDGLAVEDPADAALVIPNENILKLFQPTNDEVRERYVMVCFSHGVREMGGALGGAHGIVALLLRAVAGLRPIHECGAIIPLPAVQRQRIWPELAGDPAITALDDPPAITKGPAKGDDSTPTGEQLKEHISSFVFPVDGGPKSNQPSSPSAAISSPFSDPKPRSSCAFFESDPTSDGWREVYLKLPTCGHRAEKILWTNRNRLYFLLRHAKLGVESATVRKRIGSMSHEAASVSPGANALGGRRSTLANAKRGSIMLADNKRRSSTITGPAHSSLDAMARRSSIQRRTSLSPAKGSISATASPAMFDLGAHVRSSSEELSDDDGPRDRGKGRESPAASPSARRKSLQRSPSTGTPPVGGLLAKTPAGLASPDALDFAGTVSWTEPSDAVAPLALNPMTTDAEVALGQIISLGTAPPKQQQAPAPNSKIKWSRKHLMEKFLDRHARIHGRPSLMDIRQIGRQTNAVTCKPRDISTAPTPDSVVNASHPKDWGVPERAPSRNGILAKGAAYRQAFDYCGGPHSRVHSRERSRLGSREQRTPSPERASIQHTVDMARPHSSAEVSSGGVGIAYTGHLAHPEHLATPVKKQEPPAPSPFPPPGQSHYDMSCFNPAQYTREKRRPINAPPMSGSPSALQRQHNSPKPLGKSGSGRPASPPLTTAPSPPSSIVLGDLRLPVHIRGLKSPAEAMLRQATVIH